MYVWNMRQIVVIYAVMTEKVMYVQRGLKSVSDAQQPNVQIVLVLDRSMPQGTCKILDLAYPKFRDEYSSNPTTPLLQPLKQEIVTIFESCYTHTHTHTHTFSSVLDARRKFFMVRECRK
jgi:hypothetical protein